MEEQILTRDVGLTNGKTSMNGHQSDGLERSLSQLETVSEALLKMTSDATNLFKKIRVTARDGNLSKLRRALEEAENTTRHLRDEFVQVSRKWKFDDTTYLASEAFQQDLLAMARTMGVEIFEHEGALYSYPVILRVLAKEKLVALDRSREVRLRPSYLVKRLKELQSKPARFKPETFLDILFSAYAIAVSLRGNKELIGSGMVIPLIEIYQLFTLLPWQSAEYTKQEFTRDIYFLDKSGCVQTKKGHRVSFHASTGVRDGSKSLTIIGQGGRLRTYYGTSFVHVTS